MWGQGRDIKRLYLLLLHFLGFYTLILQMEY